MFIQLQLVMIVSAPSLRKRNKGKRLTKNASFTAVLTSVRAQFECRGSGDSVVRTGYERRVKMMIKLEAIVREVEVIAATWICTKSFWFLRPTDELLSFRSRSNEPWSSTRGAKVSSFRCWQASFGG